MGFIDLTKNLLERSKNRGVFKTFRLACNFKNIKYFIYYHNTLPKLFNNSLGSLLHANILELRQATLNYIQLNHEVDNAFGTYSFKPGGPPLLYASCYAALTRHIYRDLDLLSFSERAEWVAYLQGFQNDDGLFRDPLIDIPLATETDSWGWRHLTMHVLMALSALGGVAQKAFLLLNRFRKPGQMSEWCESRNWKNDPTEVSNELQNYAVMLQYSRDFQNEAWCQDALDELYLWLDRHQDPKTGLWGNGFDSPYLLSLGVQTGYHLWLLYFYDHRPIQYVDRIIDSCLATQNRLGGFGVPLNASACEDIDSIDPLARLYHQTDYRRADIRETLEKALPWVLFNANPDGGWVFRRGATLKYGHDLMMAQPEVSSMFPTWFRTLSLAYLAEVLEDATLANLSGSFSNHPGLNSGIPRASNI